MRIKPTFNTCTKNRYRPPVAKVYGAVRGIPFQQVFKSVVAAERVAARWSGVVSLL